MIERPSLMAGAGATETNRRNRRVAGKGLLAASAGGMAVVIAWLLRGSWLEAATAFLLTLGALEIMLQRALARFDATAALPAAARRRQRAREPAEPATVAD
jgi:hypothetical protein